MNNHRTNRIINWELSSLLKLGFKRPVKSTKERSPRLVILSPQRNNTNEETVIQQPEETTTVLGALRCPWRLGKQERELETIFVMARRSYTNENYLSFMNRAITRFSAELDTRTGSSFIRHLLVPNVLQRCNRPIETRISVGDGSNRQLSSSRTINIAVHDGSRTIILKFNAFDRVRTEAILDCDFYDAHVGAIQPRKRVIEPTDGTSVRTAEAF